MNKTTVDAVRARFQPVIADIEEGAVARERQRELPHKEVEQLRASGFGALRIPARHGGAELTFTEFTDLLIELARADSNIVQLMRGHIGFVEFVLTSPPGAERDFWLAEIAGGALIGNAHSERSSAPITTPQATLERAPAGWRLNGRKYYSTGSIFADWIYTNAYHGQQYATALVRGTARGVDRLDDWDGFGQRLTGSGTTVFTNVEVPDLHVSLVDGNELPVSSLNAIYQLVHLATLAGIAQAARRDAITFVRQRTRNGLGALTELPRDDPQVQQVVGEVSALAFAAAATTRAAAAAVQHLQEREQAGAAADDAYAETDAAVFQAQLAVIDLTLKAATDLFRVGGSSATSTSLALDRHWRNARTIASHNPEPFRARAVGDYLLNGSVPARLSYADQPGSRKASST